MLKSNEINVNKPSLAPIEEYTEILQSAWESGVLTHNGPLVQQLEQQLAERLKVKNIVAVTNGTIALQLAIRTLNLQGEIITTPFTWIATTSAIQWENCTPVYTDIDPSTFNIDPSLIEAQVTENTCAIMPVHVFSNPCDIEAIEDIARKYNLKVIYDAAHAMWTNFQGKSVLEFGDISATSFHATKIFNTGEGGACVAKNVENHEKLKRLRFFGHNDEKNIVDYGCNGKMTEVHAALGLANLKYINEVLANRKQLYKRYEENLGSLDSVTFQKYNNETYNYSYMPIVLKNESLLQQVVKTLEGHDILARRYFYPSLNTISTIAPYKFNPVSEDIARRILCLPLYYKLPIKEVDRICELIHSVA